jgi:hypothetical protein
VSLFVRLTLEVSEPTQSMEQETAAPASGSSSPSDPIPKRWQLGALLMTKQKETTMKIKQRCLSHLCCFSPFHSELSIFLGGVAGFLSALFIACIYLPSAVSTTLKFRYGEIPSLGNRTFQKYREAGTSKQGQPTVTIETLQIFP